MDQFGNFMPFERLKFNGTKTFTTMVSYIKYFHVISCSFLLIKFSLSVLHKTS